MKAAFIIFVFCVIFSSAVDAIGDHHEIEDAMTKCILDLGVDGKIIGELLTNPEAKSDDSKIRCFFKCLLEEIKWMDKTTNELLLDGPTYEMDEAMMKAAKECAALDTVNVPEACDKAYNFNKCILEKKIKNKQ